MSRLEEARQVLRRVLGESNRGAVGEELAKFKRPNVSDINATQAVQIAEEAFARAGVNLQSMLPNLEENFIALKAKMRHAMDIPRIQMPVIDPQDMGRFIDDLNQGNIDIFRPWANIADLMPELQGDRFAVLPKLGKQNGEAWLRLGRMDTSAGDDAVRARIELIPCSKLLPLQNEIWYRKLLGEMLKYGAPDMEMMTGPRAPTIIVSAEGYILDGHHRFGQAMLADPSLRMKALHVPLDVKLLLKVGRSYGSALGNEFKG